MTKYIGFTFAASMLAVDGAEIHLARLTPASHARSSWTRGNFEEDVQSLLRDWKPIVSFCDSSHKAVLGELYRRFGVEVAIPAETPVVALNEGDDLVVINLNGGEFSFDHYSLYHSDLVDNPDGDGSERDSRFDHLSWPEESSMPEEPEPAATPVSSGRAERALARVRRSSTGGEW